MPAIDYAKTADRLIILPRRGKPPPPHRRMGLPIERAVTDRQITGEARVRLIADVIIDAAGLRRLLHVQNHEAAEPEKRLIAAAETPMPQADAHRDKLAARLGYTEWAELHRAMTDLEKQAKRRATLGRVRCEIYAVGEKG